MHESKVFDLIRKEAQRQENTVELIASENFVSTDILDTLGSICTNKYAEGYPGKRYYGGCGPVDEIEEYCKEQWLDVFYAGSEGYGYHVNVQPHSGTQANMAAYAAVLKPGDTILSMSLNNGGHLSHGSPASFSGKTYNIISYGVTDSGWIDYDDLEAKIRIHHPQIILAGASAYSRKIDFKRIHDIIIKCSDIGEGDEYYRPYFMVDMSHIAGLVATGWHMTPFGYADIITTTTHKTLRGPRGGLIFCMPDLAKKIDSAVFPNIQGGPHMNTIAAKAICAEEAGTEEFRTYISQVVANADAMADQFKNLGFEVVTGGTDNHMFLLDFSHTHRHVTGKMVQDKLDECGITVNKNMVPGDTRKPAEASGIRIGTPAMTTKGWGTDDFVRCANKIGTIVDQLEFETR